MDTDSPRAVPDPVAEPARPTVRDADEKWGCDWTRCLEKARFVVTGASGYQRGACSAHIKEVLRVAHG